jgi:hypothetical protein
MVLPPPVPDTWPVLSVLSFPEAHGPAAWKSKPGIGVMPGIYLGLWPLLYALLPSMVREPISQNVLLDTAAAAAFTERLSDSCSPLWLL